MDTAEFCFWLRGIFEVCNPTELDAKQVKIIKRQLDSVDTSEDNPADCENDPADTKPARPKSARPKGKGPGLTMNRPGHGRRVC